MRLADARAFAFDLDGTLVRPSHDGPVVLPGAREVLDALRASGRPFAIFTNASHITPAAAAERLLRAGLPVDERNVLTSLCSARSHLLRRHRGRRTLLVGNEVAHRTLAGAGVALVPDEAAATAEVVLVAHTDRADMDVLEGAARAVLAGAPFLTTNYQRAYAGADGEVLSRGAMATAAIAKAAGRRPTVVGKPSRAAVHELSERLGVPSAEIAVVGDDVAMDIALGKLGGSRTVLVATGISGGDVSRVAAARRPDLVVSGVGELLGLIS